MAKTIKTEKEQEEQQDQRDDYTSDLGRIQADWMDSDYITDHAVHIAQMSKDLKEIEDQTVEALQISVLKSQAAAHLLARLEKVLLATFPGHHAEDLRVIRDGLRMIAGDPTLVDLEYQIGAEPV